MSGRQASALPSLPSRPDKTRRHSANGDSGEQPGEDCGEGRQEHDAEGHECRKGQEPGHRHFSRYMTLCERAHSAVALLRTSASSSLKGRVHEHSLGRVAQLINESVVRHTSRLFVHLLPPAIRRQIRLGRLSPRVRLRLSIPGHKRRKPFQKALENIG